MDMGDGHIKGRGREKMTREKLARDTDTSRESERERERQRDGERERVKVRERVRERSGLVYNITIHKVFSLLV